MPSLLAVIIHPKTRTQPHVTNRSNSLRFLLKHILSFVPFRDTTHPRFSKYKKQGYIPTHRKGALPPPIPPAAPNPTPTPTNTLKTPSPQPAASASRCQQRSGRLFQERGRQEQERPGTR